LIAKDNKNSWSLLHLFDEMGENEIRDEDEDVYFVFEQITVQLMD